MIAVRDHLERFGEALPVVVGFSDPARLAAYRNSLQVPFPVISDPDRALYRLLGAERGSLRQVWSLGTVATYARLVRQGRRPRLPMEDTRQLGADAVIDGDGRLVRRWLQPSPDVRPSVDDLADAVASLDRR